MKFTASSNQTAHSLNVSSTSNSSALIRLALPYLQAQSKCRVIWDSLQSADYRKKGSLDRSSLSILLSKSGVHLKELLHISSVEEILTLLDEDEDGELNEDEQVLIFTAVKERMQIIAEDLCQAAEYRLYKEINDVARKLEKDIFFYQNELRQALYRKQLLDYKAIGQDKIKHFTKKWDSIFTENTRKSTEQFSQLSKKHEEDLLNFDLAPFSTQDRKKIKPSPMIKDLMAQEKLLGAYERWGEANGIKKDYLRLQKFDEERAQSILELKKYNERRNLINRQRKESRRSEIRIQSGTNMLKIRHNSEQNRLDKEVGLKYNDIIRNQRLASKLAGKIANCEIRRQKFKEKHRHNQRAMSLEHNVELVKLSVRNMSRFNIRSDGNRAVNEPPVNSFSANTNKILERSRLEKPGLVSLASLYNHKLELI